MTTLFKKNTISLLTVLMLFSVLAIFRSNNISNKEISWDVLGYYLPLPATFIYQDPLMNDRSWVEKINEKEQLSSTIYQISSNDEGKPMYFFLFGMSFFYSIFFFIGHVIAGFTGFAQDGFSTPYQLALVYGCMVYTLIGLIYFRKILLNFFNDRITAIVIFIIVIGTNYTNHMTLKNLETVNILFMLSSILIWNTIQWHKSYRFPNLLGIGISLTLMALVKPSEVLFLALPVLWNVTSWRTMKDKWQLILLHKKHFLAVIAICFILCFPQMLYWHIKSGHWFYDTYKNAGVGLDLFSPHIVNTLFSYRKGWLIYTPVMLFSLIGFIFLFKRNKILFPALAISFFVSFYIVASWTEWWYGAGFSNRPLITYYPLLGITLGYFLVEMTKWKWSVKLPLVGIICFFMFLNQFQWWQLRNYILDPYRTTKEYYWATFLKTTVSPEQQRLLLVSRDFSGKDVFDHSKDYVAKIMVNENYDQLKNGVLFSDSTEEFTCPQRIPYVELTQKDHAWIEVTFDYKSSNNGEPNLLAFCMERKEGAYGYKTFEMENDTLNWKHITVQYLTPEIRNTKDVFKMDCWKRSHNNLMIDNFKLIVYQKRK